MMGELVCEPSVVMEDVRIIFRNFAGVEGKFNAEGDRNFGVILPDMDIAEHLTACGYNVKYLRPMDEGEEPTPWLPVSVKYRARDGRKVRAPRVTMITSNNRTSLTEQTIDLLDDVDILSCDLIVRPYEWNVRGEGGIKAYLQSMYITINEDVLERKYSTQKSNEDDE